MKILLLVVLASLTLSIAFWFLYRKIKSWRKPPTVAGVEFKEEDLVSFATLCKRVGKEPSVDFTLWVLAHHDQNSAPTVSHGKHVGYDAIPFLSEKDCVCRLV